MKDNISTIKLDKLPLPTDDIYKYLDQFPNSITIISRKDISFDKDEDILNYLTNCGVKECVIRFDYDEKLESFLLSYIKFDRIIDIINLNDIWLSILYPKPVLYMNEDLSKFIEYFKEKHKDVIEEVCSFIYSMHMVVSSIIVEEDKDLKDTINNAEKKTAKYIDGNIVSIYNSIQFEQFIASLDGRYSIIKYSQFEQPTLDSKTIIAYMLDNYTPYKAMYMYNDMIRHPENKVKLEKQLKDIADMIKKEG